MEGEKANYSHFGEDEIVRFLFGDDKDVGFYVDVGCYHPVIFSNTYMFYKLGWRGILVDANPFMIDLCREMRPGDTALNMAVGGHDGTTTLYKFNNWGSSNTTDPDFRDYVSRTQNVDVTESINIDMLSLNSLFSKYCHNIKIDFLNIDIENADFAALGGNDWSKFRPKVIAIEDLGLDPGRPQNSPIHAFLVDRGYRLVSNAIFTSIYVANESFCVMNPLWQATFAGRSRLLIESDLDD